MYNKMIILFHLVYKDFLVVLRDKNALAALFIMPAAFIIIMSLSLQTKFEERSIATLKVHVLDKDGGRTASEILEKMTALPGWQIDFTRSSDWQSTPFISDVPVVLNDRVMRGKYDFLIIIF